MRKHDINFVRNYLLNKNIELLSEEYKSNSQSLKCKCLVCEHIFWNNFSNLYNKSQGCKKCASKKLGNERKHSYEFVKDYLFGKNIELLNVEYKNANQVLGLKCLKCNHKFENSFNNIYYKNQGCSGQCQLERYKQTCFKNFGTEYPLQNREIMKKAAKNQNKSYIFYHWKTNEEIVCHRNLRSKSCGLFE